MTSCTGSRPRPRPRPRRPTGRARRRPNCEHHQQGGPARSTSCTLFPGPRPSGPRPSGPFLRDLDLRDLDLRDHVRSSACGLTGTPRGRDLVHGTSTIPGPRSRVREVDGTSSSSWCTWCTGAPRSADLVENVVDGTYLVHPRAGARPSASTSAGRELRVPGPPQKKYLVHSP